MIDSVEIPTAILVSSTVTSSKKVTQMKTTDNRNMSLKPEVLYLNSTWSKIPELPLEFRRYLS